MLRRYIDIVGRGEVVVVGTTEETITIGETLEDTVACDDVTEIVLRCFLRTDEFLLSGLCLLGHRTVEHVERGQGFLVFDGDIDHRDEVGTIARVAKPYTVLINLVGIDRVCLLLLAVGELLAELLDSVSGILIGIIVGEVACLGHHEISLGHFGLRYCGLGLSLCLHSGLFGSLGGCCLSSELGLGLATMTLGSGCCGRFFLFGLWRCSRQIAEERR